MQYKCWSTTNKTTHVLKYPLCCPVKSRQGEPSQRGQKCWLRNKPCELSRKTKTQTNQNRYKSTTHGREKKDQQQRDSTPLRQSCLSETYAEDQPKGCQLVQGKPAHLTLQRNPIKDESLPNLILFTFVTVVLLEILVPKI